MKPRSILPLLLSLGLLTPLVQAQDSSAKIQEIEQKVLLEKYQKAIQAVIGSARELQSDATGKAADLLGKRLQWLAAVDGQIKAEGKIAAAKGKDMTGSAGTLNDLAWEMITSPIPTDRQPEIALKLADIAIELGGEEWDLKPNALDTRARALFLLGKRDEAIAGQEKAVSAAADTAKAGLEATLAAYRKGELPEISVPAGSTEALDPAGTTLSAKELRNRIDEIVTLQRQLGEGRTELKDALAKRMDALTKLTGLTDPSDQNYGSSAVAYILNKIRGITLPTVDFEDTTLEDAVEFLRKRSIELDTTELDPARKGLNIVVRYPPVKPASPGAKAEPQPEPVRIKSLHLRNVPLSEALRYICEATRFRYKVDDYAVTLIDPKAPEDFFNRTFVVPQDFGSSLVSVQELLKLCGVNFPEGGSAKLISPDRLIVRNVPSEIDKIEMLIAALASTQAEKEANGVFTPPVAPAPVPPSER